MISMDKEYVTRDGREARVYATDAGNEFPVHGAILTEGDWVMTNWTTEGYMWEFCREDEHDLIEKKDKFRFVRWVNVYPESISAPYISKEEADLSSREFRNDRVSCVKVIIEGEIGEGLEEGS